MFRTLSQLAITTKNATDGKKTYIMAAVAILFIWWGVYNGNYTEHQAIERTIGIAIAVALRSGVSSQPAGTNPVIFIGPDGKPIANPVLKLPNKKA